MNLRRSTIVCAGVALLVAAVPGVAHATKDSGVQSRSCTSQQFGKLTVTMRGSGNLFPPGAYAHLPFWKNPGAGVWQTHNVYDNDTGGGAWRAVAGDTYSTASPGCSAAG